MSAAPAELRTERLLLRRRRPQDAAPMLAINRDPEVARYLNRPMTEAALAAFQDRLAARARGVGAGLATEAAVAARGHAFATLRLPELIAIVHPHNARSQAVARKLGMAIERHVHNPVLRRFVDVWALAAPAST